MERANYIAVKNNRVVTKVYVNEIEYVLRDKRKLIISTDEGTYTFYEKIGNIAPLLDESFFPSLQGCYINLYKVKKMEDNQVIFDSGNSLYLGNHSFIRTKQKYYLHLKLHESRILC